MHYYMTGVLTVSWLFWFWDTYLDFRQYKVYKQTKNLPVELKAHIKVEEFEKSRSYSIDKSKFSFVSSLYNQLQSSLVLCYFLMPYFWNMSRDIMTKQFKFNNFGTLEWEICQSLIFLFITSVASTLVNLPLSIYNTFVIEERHGFNKQTARFYAWDKVKMFSISYFISAPIVAVMIYIVRNGGPYFFLYLWIFCFAVVLLLIFFHGEIAALFDKFTSLPHGELRDKIESMAQSQNFPLGNIFVVEGSKRSSHSNAYQSGVFGKKRIVIYDTLIEDYSRRYKADEKDSKCDETEKADSTKDEDKQQKGCNDDEIVAVLCHELGHWFHGHLLKNLVFVEINYFFVFLIFSTLYNDPTLYAAFGFTREQPVVIGIAILMMILTPYNELMGFITTLMSRKFEYQADKFAVKRGYCKNLQSALIKLNKDNLSFPVHDELYSTFNHSHPTLIQRLNALKSKIEDLKSQ